MLLSGLAVLLVVCGILAVALALVLYGFQDRFNPNLVTCPDCGRRISPQALICPRCGRPFKG